MSHTTPHPHEGHDVESELLLEEMGYQPQLQRGLNIPGNLALTLSDITPTASLLVVATAVIATAGTGSLWAYLIGGFIALNVALCMGELGSMFPVAGGRRTEYRAGSPSQAMPVIVGQLLLALQVGQQKIYS